MQVAKSLMAMAAVVAVSACSKPAPSESDAKNVIQGLLGDCRYVTLDHFERVNGIPKGENGYQVEIKYTLKATPVPENVRLIASQAAKLSEVNERLQRATNERGAIHKKMGEIEDKASKEYQDLYKLSWDKDGPYNAVEKIEQEKRGIINSINPTANFAKECPNLNRVIYANVFSDESVDQFAKSFAKEFSGSLMMIQTDKGWMASN